MSVGSPTPPSGRECPACGAPLQPWRQDLHGLDPDDAGRYALVRCPSCATAVTLGPPPGPERYETGIYRPGRPLLAPVIALAQRLGDRQVLRLLRSGGVGPGARVLDAGAGRGRLVAVLRRAGYRASGLEPSARGLAAARDAGTPVARGTIEGHRAAALDAVILWHVLEHLDDPRAALLRVRAWLAPDAIALIAVPNLGSVQARLAGDGWLHLDLPRHRVHLTPAGLEALVRHAGLEPVRSVHMVWEHNPGGMWMALMARARLGEPGLPFLLLKRTLGPTPRRLAALLLGLPLVGPAIALEVLAAGRQRGGTLAMVVRATSRKSP